MPSFYCNYQNPSFFESKNEMNSGSCSQNEHGLYLHEFDVPISLLKDIK